MASQVLSHRLKAFVSAMDKNHPNVRCLLVHEAALAALDVSNALFADAVDVFLLDDGEFRSLGVEAPAEKGAWADAEAGGLPCRLWSKESLGIEGAVSSVEARRYGCRTLAPEILLSAMPLSPGFPMMREHYARLAAILFADEMGDDELLEFQRYVRSL